jgi:hypothetical protein
MYFSHNKRYVLPNVEILINVENIDTNYICSKNITVLTEKLPISEQSVEKCDIFLHSDSRNSFLDTEAPSPKPLINHNYKVIYSKVVNKFGGGAAEANTDNLTSRATEKMSSPTLSSREYLNNPYPNYSSIILTPDLPSETTVGSEGRSECSVYKDLNLPSQTTANWSSSTLRSGKSLNNKILCIAPPSIVSPNELFSSPLQETTPYSFVVNIVNNYTVTELIEGTMINLFYDYRYQTWEIATRTSVGGNYWFTRTEYKDLPSQSTANKSSLNTSQKTFREMFFDAIGTNDINEFFKIYNKDYCYNFILQHPENHIVLPITYPLLYLISIYDLSSQNINIFSGENAETKNEISHDVCRTSEDISIRSIIKIDHRNQPFIYEHMQKYNRIFFPLDVFCSYNDFLENNNLPSQATANRYSTTLRPNESLNTCYENCIEERFINFLKQVSREYAMGIMVTCLKTGKTTAIINDTYEMIKNIRGNNSNLQYHFFELYKTNKVNEFLSFFPKYKNIFYNFSKKYQDFVTKTHQAYYSYYINKEREELIEKKYFIHAAKIHHEIHIPENRVIKRAIVLEYFNKMTPSQLMYYTVNYPKKY